MEKYRNASRKQIPGFGAQKRNISQKKPNIIDLVQSHVPSKIKKHKAFKSYNKNLIFTENLYKFLLCKKPEYLEDLSFGIETDDLYTLQCSLLEIIIDKCGYTIHLPNFYSYNQDDCTCDFSVLYNVPWISNTWFLIDISIMEVFPEEIKIGFIHYLMHLSSAFVTDDFNYNFLTADFDNDLYNDHYFGPLCEWIATSMYGDDKDCNYDEELCCKKFQENDIPYYKEKQGEILEYYKKSIIDFYSYVSDKDSLNEISDLFKEAFKLDFTVFNAFTNNENFMDDGIVPYESSLLIFYDSEKSAEGYIWESINMDAQNGGCEPMGAYYVNEKGDVEDFNTPEQIEEFQKVQQIIVKICEKVYDYYRENKS